MYSLTDKLWIKVKNAYIRITFSRFTAAFFLFGFVHCFAQGMIQSFLFSIDSDSSSLISTIVREAQVPPKELAWLTRQNGDFTLQLCNDIPAGQVPLPCVTIFESGQPNMAVPAGFRRSNLENVTTNAYSENIIATSSRSASGVLQGVTVSMNDNQGTFFLNTQCTRVLVYPNQVLQNFKREDLALLGVQFWLFFVSFVAVLYDSVPHTLAVLCARVLTTAWSAYSIWRSSDVEVRFRALVIDPTSPCHANLFPTYFQSRIGFEIADLVLNCTALILSGYLSTHLLKVYSANTFKRVGPPPNILRIYRFFLAVFVCLQLSSFLLVTAMGLWIDQLMNTAVALMSTHTKIYVASFLFTAILLVPWVIMGWFAVRREMKRVMAAFLLIGLVFITGWAVMYYSQIYRWQWIQWPFFASMSVAAYIVMVASCVLGVICWRNFHQGLAHYLYVEDVLSSTDFEQDVFPHDLEKGADLLPAYPPPIFVNSVDIKRYSVNSPT